MPTSNNAATSCATLRRLVTLGALGLSLSGLVGLAGMGTVVATAPAVSAQPAPLQITTTTLPDGTRGQPYPATTLAATGGTPPYIWSTQVASQPVPPGLTVSPQGVISGAPAAAGTYTFEVDVSDSGSSPQSSSTDLTITVHQGPHFAPGSVLAWGYDAAGELGNPAFASSDIDAPNPVTLPPGTVATAISAGIDNGYALTTDGHVYAWGANNGSQLEVGQTGRTLRFSATPLEVCAVGGCANGPLSGIVAISAGGDYALALTSSGQVLGWGLDNNGQVGNGTRNPAGITTPVPVCAPGSTPDAGTCSTGVLSGIKAVSAGASGTSLALTDGGGVLAWGVNSYGQVGNGTTGPLFGIFVPQPVCAPAGCAAGNLTGITAISSGASQNEMALTTSGGVLAWGRNTFGQLGNGTQTDSYLPTPVSIPAGDTVS